MHINRKLFSTTITALLLLSVLAVPVFALDPTSVVNLSVTSGSVGRSVTVSGPGAASPVGANPFGQVRVFWDNLATVLNDTTFAAADGSYSARIRIPTAVQGTHYVIVQDSLGTQASAVFTVTPSLSIAGPPGPTRALPGDSLTVTGTGFAANDAITLVLASTTLATPVSITFPAGVTSYANGTFTATIVIPTTITTAQFDTYTLTATDEAANTASATVIINYYLQVFPSSAPPGVSVMIMGRIPASTGYIVAVDTTTIFTGTTDSAGRFTQTWTIPALIATGAHTLTVTWNVVNSASATLTVTAPPTIALSAASGVPGATVTVTGAGFVGRANVTLSYGTTVVNSTALDSRFGPTDLTGALSAQFAVPSLAPGPYAVTVTDQYGASASAPGGFTVLAAPTTSVSTAGSYAQGDTLSFTITTTDPAVTSVAVMIKDPNGIYWWGTPDLAITWPVIFDPTGFGYTPYTLQLAYGLDNMHLTLPANAPLGAWNWTITLPAASTSLPLKRTGLFTVTAVAGADVLASMNSTINAMNASLNAMNATLNQMNARLLTINGTVATIQTSTGTITTTLTALGAKVDTINNGVATLSTSMGQVTASVQSLSSSISGINGGVATIQTSLGTITTSLSSIGTRVTSIEGKVATVQTDLGTLSGTVTSVDGKVATIQTNLGTMQADISQLQDDVASTKSTSESLSPLIIVAIVLALVAAIAAIASIIFVRRKIAG